METGGSGGGGGSQVGGEGGGLGPPDKGRTGGRSAQPRGGRRRVGRSGTQGTNAARLFSHVTLRGCHTSLPMPTADDSRKPSAVTIDLRGRVKTGAKK